MAFEKQWDFCRLVPKFAIPKITNKLPFGFG